MHLVISRSVSNAAHSSMKQGKSLVEVLANNKYKRAKQREQFAALCRFYHTYNLTEDENLG